MKITADTNVLLRIVLDDHEAQQRLAIQTLERADLVAIGVQSFCEFVWVFDRGCGTARAELKRLMWGTPSW